VDYCFNYDKEEDVLYINIGNKPQKADFASRTGDFIIRYKKDNSVVGITILNARAFITKISSSMK